MITITPASKEEREALCQKEGIPSAEGLMLRDGEENAGYALYKLEDSRLFLLVLRADDGLFLEGLVRAVLNAGRLLGAREAFCANPDAAALLNKLGFRQEDEGWAVSISAFFARPCGAGRQ